MARFSEPFNVGRVRRASGFQPAACCTPVSEVCTAPEHCPEPRAHIPWPEVDKIVVSIQTAVHADTGKPWLVQNCMAFDPACGWQESCEGVYELPALYKAPQEGEAVTLPSFNGGIAVDLESGQRATLFGGEDLPSDMLGSILCMNGELCYFPAPQEAVAEVQIGGPAPRSDSGVKVWISDGTAKYAGPSGWTQVNPYGAKV